MSRVGGPLIDVSALTAWERKKFYGVAARIRLAKGIHIRSADWHGLGRRERALASIVAAGVAAPTCIVAGKSAALIHGLPLPGWEDSHPVELAAHGVTGAGRTRGGVVHRHLSLRQSVAAEVVETRFGKVHVTPVAGTGLDLARWHDVTTGVRCLDHALARGTITREDIDAALARAAGRVGVDAMRDTARLATPWSGSPRESDLKVALWEAGLPAPHQQVILRDHLGSFIARLDFCWPEIGFGTEYDGGGKLAGEFGIPVEIAARDDVIRQHRISNLGVLNFRVNNHNLSDGSAVPRIVAMYRRVAERGVPLDPALWTSAGLAWSSSPFTRQPHP
ncbi:hypothetical protein B842_11495 [Corynebacterium humireducens NBRC 106098 = DSM 45392]|uniref:Uncharacterized protein n=1 Tax=Corynebacterium humireducens NBRC 106098 = DSM 45392 TaxID=1223515 RepID=A0A0B5D5P4_9CORY|nr:hypothetical protein [Corynebacterium humireducens]AJE34146.1 hypothetical protein B842_11495 [Corynebacterium humireducens NBRC 106098 = DSM 45392]